jgi:CBS domain-containing protein
MAVGALERIVRPLVEKMRIADGGRRAAKPTLQRITSSKAETIWTAALALLSASMIVTSWALSRRSARREVQDLMVGDVVAIDSSTTLMEAAEQMRKSNVGILPVVEAGTLVGVITDRDLVVRALAEGVHPSSRVAEYATRDVVCARPTWDVHHAMQVMAACQVGRLPVVDDEDRVVGIITLSSLALRSQAEDGRWPWPGSALCSNGSE